MPRLKVALGLCLLLALAPLQAAELRGKVIGVTDGDTLTLLDANKQQHKIRLNGIDAPESGQAFGQVSKQGLSTLVFGQDVVVVWSKTDLYGRKVGTVMRGAVNANLEQLRAGLAWYFRRYESDVAPANRPIYATAEADARAAKRGLWRDANPQPPWEFRSPSTPAPSTASTPRPLIGGSVASARGIVIGNRNSNIYHVPGCMDYDKVAERNRVYFQTEAAAAAAGFRKAKNCK
jgi:endonuclease YncB( thermonuclease family)